MTPEQAITKARLLAKRTGRLSDDIESEALLGYVQASQSYRADRGCSFNTYVSRRMHGAIREVLRRDSWAVGVPAGDCWTQDDDGKQQRILAVAPDVPIDEPEPVLRRIESKISRKSAVVAWLYWGLDYGMGEISTILGVTESRIYQVLRRIEEVFHVERVGARKRHMRKHRSRKVSAYCTNKEGPP